MSRSISQSTVSSVTQKSCESEDGVKNSSAEYHYESAQTSRSSRSESYRAERIVSNDNNIETKIAKTNRSKSFSRMSTELSPKDPIQYNKPLNPRRRNRSSLPGSKLTTNINSHEDDMRGSQSIPIDLTSNVQYQSKVSHRSGSLFVNANVESNQKKTLSEGPHSQKSLLKDSQCLISSIEKTDTTSLTKSDEALVVGTGGKNCKEQKSKSKAHWKLTRRNTRVQEDNNDPEIPAIPTR